MKRSSYSKRVLAVLCAVAMVLTMFPTSLMFGGVSYAEDSTGTEAAETVNDTAQSGEESKSAQDDKEAAQTEDQTEEKTAPETSSEKNGNDAAADKKPAVSEEVKTDDQTEAKSEEKKEEKKDEGYKVEFDFGDNYARFNSINPKTTDKDGKIKLPEKPKAREKVYKAEDGKEYYFTGWKYKDKEYEPGDEVTLKADAKFKAVWKQTYTIKFSAKGIKADKVESQTEVYGEDVVLPNETASKDGQDFAGWTPDNGKTVYEAGKTIEAKNIQPKSRLGKNALVKLSAELKPSEPSVYFIQDSCTDTTVFYVIDVESDGATINKIEYAVGEENETPSDESGNWETISSGDKTGSIVIGKTLYARVTYGEEENESQLSKSIKTKGLENHENETGVAPEVTITKIDNSTNTQDEAGKPKKTHTVEFTATDESEESFASAETVTVKLNGSDVTDQVTFGENNTGSIELTDCDGSKTLYISARDAVGHHTTVSQILLFDNTAPEATIQMTGSPEYSYSAVGGNYYNSSNDSVSITVEDTDANLKTVSVTATVGTTEIPNETFTAESPEISGKTFTLTKDHIAGSFNVEGALTITVNAEDVAGNKLEDYGTITGGSEEETDFYVDTVAPVLASANTAMAGKYDADVDPNNYYYGVNSPTTTYVITDTYVRDDSTVVTFTKEGDAEDPVINKDGTVVTATWTGKSKNTVTYSGIAIQAGDKAGNKLAGVSADYASATVSTPDDAGYTFDADNGKVSFTKGKVIDFIAPIVSVQYTLHNSSDPDSGDGKAHLYLEGDKYVAYFNGGMTATVTVTDDKALKPDNIHIDKDVAYKKTVEENKNLIYITDKNDHDMPVPLTLSAEGEYQFVIWGTDLADNPINVIESFSPDVTEYENFDKGDWGDAAVPTTSPTETSNTLMTLVRDTTVPEYVSKEFSEVTYAGAVDTDDYTAYYGEAFRDSGIIGTFVITDNNLVTEKTNSGLESGADLAPAEGEEDSKFSGLTPVVPEEKTSVDAEVFGNTYTYKLAAKTEGAYRFYVYGADKAGNKLVRSSDTSDQSKAAATYNKTEAVTDDAGCFQSMKKVLDVKAPQFDMKMWNPEQTEDDAYYVRDKNGNEEPYQPFRKEDNANIQVKSYDRSPVHVQYNVIWKTPKGSDDWTVKNPNPYENNGYEDDAQVTDVTVNSDSQFRVSNLTVYDRAGNTCTADPYESNTIYLDNTKPNEDIIRPTAVIKSTSAVTKRVQNSDLFKDSVTLTFRIEDPNAHKSSSGLKYARYSVTVDGKEKIKDKNLEPAKVDGTEMESWIREDYSNAGKNRDDEGLYYNVEMNEMFNKGGEYESNNIYVVLEASDNAGNTVTTDYRFGIDSKGPEVVVDLSGKSVRNNKYYKGSRNATVTVKERNLGENSKETLISTQKSISVPAKWDAHKDGDDDSGNSDTWTKSFTYSKDGDYSLWITGPGGQRDKPRDALGNVGTVSYAKAEHHEDFTIDNTAPIINVSFDNNSVRNKKYYKANRTASVKITEHNFDANDVKIDDKKAVGPRKSGLAFPGLGKFSSSGDSRYASLPFTKEGSYSFKVNFIDLAGNPAKMVVVDEFVIDKTAPTVKIENVVNGGIYGGTVAPRAIFDDDTFNKAESTFRFTGVRKVDRSELIPGFRANGEYGGSYVMSNFPNIRANDDIYTAYASSTDMAGNSTTVQVVFSVNRFGSTFDYNGDQATIGLVSKETGRFYTNEAIPLVIREINVNPIKKYELTLDRGGNSVKLKEGTDYTVVKSTTEQGTVYVYRISKDIVTDEGSYNIVVKSEDAAGNINTNAAIRSEEDSTEVPVRFVYDTTAPTMSFTDIGEGDKVIELEEDKTKRFSGTDILKLGIVPEDDWSLGSIQYVLTDKNGTVDDSGVIKGDKFWDVMGEDGLKRFEEEINHGSDIKSLKVTVWDAAGNETSQNYKLLVTSNALEVAAHYWYLILLALAAVGGAYAYYRKRKKDSEGSEKAA